MTIQDPEYVYYKNVKYYSDDQPLKKLLKERDIVFPSVSTANWRGYVATWEVCDSHLYLINISSSFSSKHNEIRYVFPGAESRVLADWFSGDIDAFDELLQMSFSMYGRDQLPNDLLRLHVRKGFVMKADLRKVRHGTAKDRELYKNRRFKLEVD